MKLSSAAFWRIALIVGLGFVPVPLAWSSGLRDSYLQDETIGRTAFYQGDYSEAEAQYRRSLAQHPQDQATARDLAATLAEQIRYAEAAQVLGDAGIHGLEQGEFLIAAGNYSEATRILKTTLQEPGTHVHTWTLLGFISSLQSHYPDAVQYYWKALDENPKQATVHLWLAHAFEAMGTSLTAEHAYFNQRAREEYLAALRVDASLWQVHRELALLAEHSGNWREALQRWYRVEESTGSTPEIQEAMVRIKNLRTRPPAATPTVMATAVPTIAATTITAVSNQMVIGAGPPAPRLKNLTVKPLGQPGDPIIQVGLGNALPSVAFGCGGEWRAFDRRGRKFWKGQANKTYRIEQDPGGGWVLKSWDRHLLKHFNFPITLEPLDPQKVFGVFNLYQTDGYSWSSGWRADYYYRGQLHVVPLGGRRLRLLNKLFLEDYLVSVVPGEMEANWPQEALKAQAVVARTDVLGRRGIHWRQGYDVCTSAHCAYYLGVQAEDSRTQQAVSSTRDEVLMRNGKLMSTFYTHACGGMLQSGREAWGHGRCDLTEPGGLYDWQGNSPAAYSLPLRPGAIGAWLAYRPTVFCGNIDYSGEHSFRWFKLLTQEELAGSLDRKYGLGTLRCLRILERSPSAYVRKIQLEGTRGNHVLWGDAIRTALGLRSNLFTLIPLPAPEHPEQAPIAWLVWGGGWGHGVGLCQAGAAGMGKQGYLYQDIIRHYFPKAEVETWH